MYRNLEYNAQKTVCTWFGHPSTAYMSTEASMFLPKNKSILLQYHLLLYMKQLTSPIRHPIALKEYAPRIDIIRITPKTTVRESTVLKTKEKVLLINNLRF